ncbi:MAG TPA: cytochrome b/b6 domain-containing protein [Jatrophihabitans sp.]|jgi:formate dehydrogenase subunit gamma|uniref:cytochrome b/b6 domain-containing protein n=1 Tax=Jatrophihabitans sp. TaxID=1932789 RepID=UPI002DF98B9C|nr:cytochrome b/b6 domain-containing protein [Jatrophihabitans sp.]
MNRTLPRFARAERLVHRTVAGLTGICIVTAAILYLGPLALLVGHRRVVVLVHVTAGLALPVPLLLGLGSRAFRADLGRLNRFTPSDWRWLRSKTRRDGTIRVGKFNAGQKLNGALSAGSVLVLFGTGLLMYFPSLARLAWRTGATFVHDWFALAFGLLVLGHIAFALKDVEARRGMRTGSVSAEWAREEHAAWADELSP